MSEKMNLIVTDYNLLVNSDGYIVNSKEYSTSFISYTSEEIKEIINNKCDKVYILNIDKIISEDEIDSLSQYIDYFDKYFDYIIYSDYSIYTYYKNTNKDINKLIYDSKTLICSSQDCNSIKTNTFLSNELTYEEIDSILASTDKKISLNVFGLLQVMYSKRKFITLFNDMYNENLKIDHLYDLREVTRDDNYKIVESVNGTLIYSHFYYGIKRKLENIHKVKFLRINSLNLDETIINKVIDKLKIYINHNDITYDDLQINVKEGFLVDKLFLLKGKEDE